MIHRRTKAGRVAAQCLSSLGVVLLAWTTALGQTPTPEVVPVPLDEVAPADEAATRVSRVTQEMPPLFEPLSRQFIGSRPG